MAMAWLPAAPAGQALIASKMPQINTRKARVEARTLKATETRNATRRFDSFLLTDQFYHSRHTRSRQVANMPVGIDLFVRRCIEGVQLTNTAAPVT
jgi:hypothetical protein